MGNKNPFHKIENDNQSGNKVELDEKETSKHFTVAADGTIKFTFSHYSSEYEKLTQQIETFKSHLKIEMPLEMTAIVFKMQKVVENIKDENIRKSFENLIASSKGSVEKFYSTFQELFQEVRSSNSKNQQYILSWLKGVNTTSDLVDAKKEITESTSKIKSIYENFDKFSAEIGEIKNIINNLKISDELLIKDYEKLNSFYLENKDSIDELFSVMSQSDFRRLCDLINQLESFFNNKNELFSQFENIAVYKNEFLEKVISEANESKDADIMNELNEYFQVMIKHRFIRHIEEKIKEIQSLLESQNKE